MRRLLSVFLLVLIGCEDRPIEAYRVPKQARPTLIDVASPPVAPAAVETKPHWTLPDGWSAIADASEMRVATLVSRDGEVEVAVTVFPGDVGGPLANVNRWRQQVDLPPVASLDEQPLEHYEVAGRPVYQLDVPGLIAAGLRDGERTWFVKMTGPAAVVAAQRDAFGAFMRSWHWHDGSEGAAHGAGGEGTGAP